MRSLPGMLVSLSLCLLLGLGCSQPSSDAGNTKGKDGEKETAKGNKTPQGKETPADETDQDTVAKTDSGAARADKRLTEIEELHDVQIASREEMLAHVKQWQKALGDLEGILGSDPEDARRVRALNSKLTGLEYLAEIGYPDADAPLKKLANKLVDDKDAGLATRARLRLLTIRMEDTKPDDEPTADKLADDYLEEFSTIKGESADALKLRAFQDPARVFERFNYLNAARKLYNALKPLENSEDPNLRQMAKKIRELGLRRLSLFGKPLDLSTVTIEGRPVDLESLRGKVVLVDFWATWCRPCRESFPNMKQQYRDFKDKGFEIIGISVDDEADAPQKFLKRTKLPWIQVHDDKEGAQGQQGPLAEAFGVSGIPATFLVDPEGKVVALDTSGPRLKQYLEKYLGQVKPAAEEEASLPE